MSLVKQRIIIGSMLGVAFLALLLGIAYQANNPTSDEITSGTQADTDDTTQNINPIKRFLPQGGTGAACKESIGVQLEPGFGATLTINGTVIPPEDMNVNLDADGNITNEVTASRSRGEYSFKPSEECPQGKLVRSTDNKLDICVYRLSDSARSCEFKDSFSFDAI